MNLQDDSDPAGSRRTHRPFLYPTKLPRTLPPIDAPGCNATDRCGRGDGAQRAIGAGEGNRTLVISLEGCCSTIELHPHISTSVVVSKRPRMATYVPIHTRKNTLFPEIGCPQG